MFSEVISGRVRTHARKLRARLSAYHGFSKPAAPILVYQMGKVASSTVCASLRAARLSNPVLQIHFLSDDLPKHIEAHKNSGIKLPPYHLMLGAAIRTQLIAHSDRHCKVITLVRDPVAVVISNIFQNPQFVNENIRRKNGKISAQRVYDWLHCKLADEKTFAYQDTWFDKELKRVFGIDVFAEPFPTDTGYRTYSGERADALLIRVEDLSDKGPEALAEFTGMPQPLRFRKRNIRMKRRGAEAYAAVLKDFAMDETLCRMIYARRLATHFYTTEMIEQFIARWTKKDGG